jgi:hypothetical protein
MRRSKYELIVKNRFERSKLPMPVEEYKFAEGRHWRFDFAYPKHKIAFECEGAIWTQGRHTRGSGFLQDCYKYNAAALLGWRVLRYTPEMIDQIIPDITLLIT